MCHCGFGLLWLMAGEGYGTGGLWRFFWGVLLVFPLCECCYGVRGAMRVVFGVVW